jgi:hypothetical protein
MADGVVISFDETDLPREIEEKVTGNVLEAESLSQKSRSSIIDSQGPLSETDKGRSALAAATAQSAP